MGDVNLNKQVVADYVEAFNRGDLDALRGMFTDDAVIHGVLGSGGLDVAVPIWRELHDSFAIQLEVEGMVSEGDQVAVRYKERGTFQKPFRGQEPTGKPFELVAMEYFAIRDGKIQSRWGARDSASMWRQLGVPVK